MIHGGHLSIRKCGDPGAENLCSIPGHVFVCQQTVETRQHSLERLPESPDTIGDNEEAQLRKLRNKFLGEVGLPESTCCPIHVFKASRSH